MTEQLQEQHVIPNRAQVLVMQDALGRFSVVVIQSLQQL
jgi:hypothetical protein